jgi:quinol monooxygenase YgiN
MKKTVFIIGCVLIALIGCESKKQETAEACNCCVSLKDSVEIIMNIPVKIKPEFVSAYKAAFEKCQAATLKEETCLAYELFGSLTDATEFHLFERWANKPGHRLHMETEHVKVFFQEIKGFQEATKTKMIEVAVCPKINQ